MSPTYATFYSEVPVSATPSEASATYSGAQNEGHQYPLTPSYHGYLRSDERVALPDHPWDLCGIPQQPAASTLPNMTGLELLSMYGMLGPSSLASQPILGQPIQGPGHGSVHSCGVATQFRNGNLASHPQSLGSPSGMSAYPSVNGTNHMWPPTPVVIPKSSVPLLNAGPSTGTWSQAVARPSIHSQATSTSTSAGAVASAAYSGFFVPVELPSAGPFGLWPIGKNDNAPRNLCGLPNAQGKLCGQMYRRSDVVHHLIQQHGVDEDELRSGKEVNCPDSACRCKSNSCKELPNHTAHIRHLGPHVVGRHRGVRFSCPVSGCGRSYNHERSVDRHTKKDHRMNKAPVSLA